MLAGNRVTRVRHAEGLYWAKASPADAVIADQANLVDKPGNEGIEEHAR